MCWVLVSVQGLSPVAESGGHSLSRCAGLSLSRPLLLRRTSSRRAGSVVVAHGPSCSAACGIFPDQGSNLCPLHWQADSQPLCHQGSPGRWILNHCATLEAPKYTLKDIFMTVLGVQAVLGCHLFIYALLTTKLSNPLIVCVNVQLSELDSSRILQVNIIPTP